MFGLWLVDSRFPIWREHVLYLKQGMSAEDFISSVRAVRISPHSEK